MVFVVGHGIGERWTLVVVRVDDVGRRRWLGHTFMVSGKKKFNGKSCKKH